MKTYAIGLDERVYTNGEHFYIAPCGSCHILQLDGRENIHKNMDTTTGILKFMGYDNFVIIRIPSLRSRWQSWMIWKQITKNIPVILD